MATHTVDDDHEGCLTAGDEVDTILVLRPMARQGQLCILDAHALFPFPELYRLLIVVRGRSMPRTRAANSLMYTHSAALNGAQIV
jgi:hypothetical protein